MHFVSCSIFLNGTAITKSVHLRKNAVSKNVCSHLLIPGVCSALTDNVAVALSVTNSLPIPLLRLFVFRSQLIFKSNAKFYLKK